MSALLIFVAVCGRLGFDERLVDSAADTAPAEPPAFVAMGGASAEDTPTFVQAPITTTVPDELLVTVTMFAFPVFISSMDPPFVGLPPQSGNATGYLIARDPGTYASTFTLESGEGMTAMTCASSVSWTP